LSHFSSYFSTQGKVVVARRRSRSHKSIVRRTTAHSIQQTLKFTRFLRTHHTLYNVTIVSKYYSASCQPCYMWTRQRKYVYVFY